jgi:hypothetical protein
MVHLRFKTYGQSKYAVSGQITIFANLNPVVYGRISEASLIKTKVITHPTTTYGTFHADQDPES